MAPFHGRLCRVMQRRDCCWQLKRKSSNRHCLRLRARRAVAKAQKEKIRRRKDNGRNSGSSKEKSHWFYNYG
jgi:hypothetical protein